MTICAILCRESISCDCDILLEMAPPGAHTATTACELTTTFKSIRCVYCHQELKLVACSGGVFMHLIILV
jgi:hypothetical protein